MTSTTKKMTAHEAKSFDTFSVANATAVESALECGCKAYEDVFTYRRWKAQGFQVQRGEHGIKLPVIYKTERENEQGEVEMRRSFGKSAVFCRHQVKAVS